MSGVTEKRQQLRLLREFQDLEREIAALEAAAREIPKVLQSLEGEMATSRAEQAEREARRKSLERERLKRESDVEAERDRLRKAQGKQLEVKTNKEYTALLHEIDGIKGKIDRLETEILELMESAETAAEEIHQGAGRLREREAEAEGRKKEETEKLHRMETRLAELREIHRRLSGGINPEWLTEYRRVKAARGWAVAGLNGNICGGCHQSLMPQLIHQVKHGDEVLACPHCNRILYPPDEAQKADGKPAEPAQA